MRITFKQKLKWLSGEGVKIAAPQEVVSELQKEIQRMRRQYFADVLEMELAMKDNKC